MTVIIIPHGSRRWLRSGMAILAIAAAFSSPVVAQSDPPPAPTATEGDDKPRILPIVFQKGRSSATVKGQVHGYETVDHPLKVSVGQTLTVALKGSNSSTYFNVMEPGETAVAIFTGSRDGGRYSGALDKQGEYIVRVYQTRNAARRGGSTYTLSVTLR